MSELPAVPSQVPIRESQVYISNEAGAIDASVAGDVKTVTDAAEKDGRLLRAYKALRHFIGHDFGQFLIVDNLRLAL
jgi:hypothetical protein